MTWSRRMPCGPPGGGPGGDAGGGPVGGPTKSYSHRVSELQNSQISGCRNFRISEFQVSAKSLRLGRLPQLQNQEMRGLMRQDNLNESLLEEVQKLRMENAELKSTPFVAKFSQK